VVTKWPDRKNSATAGWVKLMGLTRFLGCQNSDNIATLACLER